MSFGFGEGDIAAISEFAAKVCIAYKDVAEEVDILQTMISKAVQHLKSTNLSDVDRQEGQKVLQGCQGILGDLYCLIQNYSSLAFANASQVFHTVQPGTEDIGTLKERLSSNTNLLSNFIRRFDIFTITMFVYYANISSLSCEYLEIQAQMTDILGLHHMDSRVPIDSITSFARNINTKEAYKEFCESLYQIGVTAESIIQKEGEILDIFKAQNTAISDKIDNSNTAAVSNCSGVKTLSIFRNILTENKIQSVAAEEGNTKSSTSTLEYIRHIKLEDDQKETVLHKAAKRSPRDILLLLPEKGALVEPINKDDEIQLHHATQNGHTSMVELLLRKGALIEAMNCSNDTLLHLAARNGHTDTVKLLLGKGAFIEAINKYKDTLLHLAASSGHTSTVEVLLEKGASTEAINWHNNTPLHPAALSGHISTVMLLLEKGAPIEAKNKYNETSLHCAIQNCYVGTVEILLGKGASIEATDKYGHTPLHLAARRGHIDIVKLLLEKNAHIDAMDNDGYTPLHLAIQPGYTSRVALPDTSIEERYTSTVELLLERGAPIEARDKSNSTPLHLAIHGNYISIVELLLRKGASIEAMDETNNTPLDWALRHGNTDIVQLLKDKAAEHVAHRNDA